MSDEQSTPDGPSPRRESDESLTETLVLFRIAPPLDEARWRVLHDAALGVGATHGHINPIDESAALRQEVERLQGDLRTANDIISVGPPDAFLMEQLRERARVIERITKRAETAEAENARLTAQLKAHQMVLEWIASQENLMFAECSQAEEIIDRVKTVLASSAADEGSFDVKREEREQ